MYKTVNTSQITCYLQGLLPDKFDEEEDVPEEDIERLKGFIELCISKSYNVTNISDITVLYIESANTNKYYLTTDISKYEQHENDIVAKTIECFFAICIENSCKINVSIGDREISDHIHENQGVIMDVGLEHAIYSNNVTLLVIKFEVDASIFYSRNVMIFPEENLLSQFYGPNFILYDIVNRDCNLRLLVTKDNIYNLTTSDVYNIMDLKYLFYNCNVPMPTISLSQYEFTVFDMEAIRSVDIESILRKVSACAETNHNENVLHVKVLYGTVII
uniref:FlP201R n=1 Tax=Flamingopox virus TaxID=503979 RepID=B1AA03_9POXV|nr:FlP201R [Flamingopox virus]